MLHVKCEKHENKKNNKHKIKTYMKDSYLDIEVGTRFTYGIAYTLKKPMNF